MLVCLGWGGAGCRQPWSSAHPDCSTSGSVVRFPASLPLGFFPREIKACEELLPSCSWPGVSTVGCALSLAAVLRSWMFRDCAATALCCCSGRVVPLAGRGHVQPGAGLPCQVLPARAQGFGNSAVSLKHTHTASSLVRPFSRPLLVIFLLNVGKF